MSPTLVPTAQTNTVHFINSHSEPSHQNLLNNSSTWPALSSSNPQSNGVPCKRSRCRMASFYNREHAFQGASLYARAGSIAICSP